MNSKIVREKREEILSEMNVLAAKLKDEKRAAFTAQEREQFDNLDKQQEEYAAQAESLERVERLDGMSRTESQQRFRGEVLSGVSERAVRSETEERNKALAGWFYHGTSRQKPEYWRAAERQGIEVSNPNMKFGWLPWEKRAQATSPGTAGGYLVAVDNSLMTALDTALKAYGNIFEVATVVETATGAPLPWPTNDDTSNVAEITGDNASIASQDLSFGQRQLSAFKYDSKFIKVSWEVERDSVIDLASYIGKQAGIRIGRQFNSDAIASGNGLITPVPLTTVATSCGTTTASNTAVTYGELLALYHGVDPAYRNEPGCGWMFADATLKVLRLLVDTAGRPLLNSSLAGISGNVPEMKNTLLEKPYFVNQAVPSGASAKAWFFGDLSKIIVRRVSAESAEGGLNVLRLVERFADNGQTAYLAWGRFDSYLSDAGTHPVQYMTNHS